MLSSDHIDHLAQYIADGLLVRHNMARRSPSFDRKWFTNAVKEELKNWLDSGKPIGMFTLDIVEDDCKYNYLVGSEWQVPSFNGELQSIYHVNRVHASRGIVNLTRYERLANRKYVSAERSSVDLNTFLGLIDVGMVAHFHDPKIRAIGVTDDEGDLVSTTEFLNDR